MFNAYYDDRKFFQETPFVRILAFINRVGPVVETFCQLGYDKLEGFLIMKTSEYRLVWHKQWANNTRGSPPYLIECLNPIAAQGFIPSSVSLVEKKCGKANNKLRIIHNLPESKKKKPFGVCVKQYDFEDDKTKLLIEWIEINSLLGADKIFMYVVKLHPNMMKVLEYYETRGIVEVTKLTYPEGLPNRNESLTQFLQNDLIPLNDCFYKHMNEFDYLLSIDIDEILMPKRPEDKTWKDLMNRYHDAGKLTRNDTDAAYVSSNVFFLSDNDHANEIQPEVPTDLHFLQHIYRASNFSQQGVGIKSFQDTEQVITVHNHFPIECVGKSFCSRSTFSKDDAQLQHYRRGCENYPKKECEGFRQHTVKDASLWKLKEEIISNVKQTVEALKNLEAR